MNANPALAITLTSLMIICPAIASSVPFSRAMYGRWNASQLASVGFDALYRPINCRSRKGVQSIVEVESLQCAAENITFILDEHYDGAAYEKGDPRLLFNYTRVVTRDGFQEPREPSPVDEVYWREWVEKCTLHIANLSLKYPIWGMVWDMEPYRRSEDKKWRTNMYSYDRQAFHEFADDMGRDFPNLSPSERHQFLAQMDLVDDFEEWQEKKLYEMAMTTAEKAHAINPNLSLGTLWFQQTWIITNILKGFNCSTAPVTAWSEQSYESYNSIDYQKQKEWWSQNSGMLNGVLIPGFWTVKHDPFDLIDNMEQAARHEGLFWVYQHHDPFQRADRLSYAKAYQLVHKHIFFNASTAHPLPESYIYPGVRARPFLGPQNTSALLEAHHLGHIVSENITLCTNTTEINYVAENLSQKIIRISDLSQSHLPCIIQGLSREDLLASEVQGMIEELQQLELWSTQLGIDIGKQGKTIQICEEHVERGEYHRAKSVLAGPINQSYEVIFDEILPLLDDPPPKSSLKIKVGARLLSEGSWREGRIYLLAGLAEWQKTIGESLLCGILSLLPFLFACRYLDKRKS